MLEQINIADFPPDNKEFPFLKQNQQPKEKLKKL
jgi:hypothetical protein